MCKTHFMGAAAQEKREALDPNFRRRCSALTHVTRMPCRNGATKQMQGTDDWVCSHHFKLSMTQDSPANKSLDQARELSGQEGKTD